MEVILTKIKPFDFITDISKEKKNLIKSAEFPKMAEKQYSAYLTNKAFSYFPDTVLFANEVNHNNLDNLLHHDFYFYEVRKKPRFSKWHTEKPSEDVNAVSEIFNINKDRAKEYLKLLSKEQLDTIKDLNNKGGKE